MAFEEEDVAVLPPNPVVRESDFKHYWLRKILNSKDPSGRTEWIEKIAITPYMEVDICADDDRKKILFTIPPYTRSPDTAMTNYFSRAVDEHQKLTVQYHEGVADNTLMRNLEGVFMENKVPEEDHQRWKEILIHFGVIKPQQGTGASDNDGHVQAEPSGRDSSDEVLER